MIHKLMKGWMELRRMEEGMGEVLISISTTLFCTENVF